MWERTRFVRTVQGDSISLLSECTHTDICACHGRGRGTWNMEVAVLASWTAQLSACRACRVVRIPSSLEVLEIYCVRTTVSPTSR